MKRPEVSVVMPCSGDRAAGEAAINSLRTLEVRPGDELIVVHNSSPGEVAGDRADGPVRVIAAAGERSPAHARNAGAAQARNEWILFLDADTIPRPALLDAFFEEEIGDDVGAVTGEVLPAPGSSTLAARYGAARSFLGQRAHYEHPYRPRAAAANLLVRKTAFEQLGGFYEGVRAGEDTDFTWRLQEAGWRLELRPRAAVEHRYRITVGELRRQWREYAAGRAWLGRRYEEFQPEPAVKRAVARARQGSLGQVLRSDSTASMPATTAAEAIDGGRLERTGFLALDLLLGLEELAGLTLSNRPAPGDSRAAVRGHRIGKAGGGDQVEVVLVADRFPIRGDPLVELAGTLDHVRVEAIARPPAGELAPTRGIAVDYLEDDGSASRWAATAILIARHPMRSAVDLLSRPPEGPPLRVLAPVVRRLELHPRARIHPLGGSRGDATAQRLARLTGRSGRDDSGERPGRPARRDGRGR